MRLVVRQTLPRAEIVHYADDRQLITSRGGLVTVRRGGRTGRVRLPTAPSRRLLGALRLTRRLLRLDKCNVAPTPDGGLIAIYQRRAWRVEPDGAVRETLSLRQCRNVLHQSLVRTPSGRWFFGEYGRNPERGPVPVYRSDDEGRSWQVVFTFPAGAIRHVHGCYWDPVEERVWVCTGDFEGECHLLVADEDFAAVEWLGDGSQVWRACRVFFTATHVAWLMDSEREPSRAVRLDRGTRRIACGQALPGPVWYAKRLSDGCYVAATAAEQGPAVRGDCAHVLASVDLERWEEVGRFRHDGWPRPLFKNGVVGFADGGQTSAGFYVFGEALRSLEGRGALCALA